MNLKRNNKLSFKTNKSIFSFTKDLTHIILTHLYFFHNFKFFTLIEKKNQKKMLKLVKFPYNNNLFKVRRYLSHDLKYHSVEFKLHDLNGLNFYVHDSITLNKGQSSHHTCDTIHHHGQMGLKVITLTIILTIITITITITLIILIS